MGIQELAMVAGAAVLLLVIMYGTIRAGRRGQGEASKAATKQMYNDNRDT